MIYGQVPNHRGGIAVFLEKPAPAVEDESTATAMCCKYTADSGKHATVSLIIRQHVVGTPNVA